MTTRTWKAPREEWTKDRDQIVFYREIGDQIRTLRRDKGWSQQTLGTAAGLTGPTIGMIESGRIRATLYHLHHIASALHCTISDLMKSV